MCIIWHYYKSVMKVSLCGLYFIKMILSVSTDLKHTLLRNEVHDVTGLFGFCCWFFVFLQVHWIHLLSITIWIFKRSDPAFELGWSYCHFVHSSWILLISARSVQSSALVFHMCTQMCSESEPAEGSSAWSWLNDRRCPRHTQKNQKPTAALQSRRALVKRKTTLLIKQS